MLRAVVAAAVAVAVAAAAAPATATDLDALRGRAQKVADEVSSLEHDLEGLRAREARLEQKIASVTARIGALESQIHDARADHDTALEVFVDRAVEAYKSGGVTTRAALLLSARDMSDLLTLVEASERVAELDSAALRDLSAARDAALATQDELDARKQHLIAAERRAHELTADIEHTVGVRRAALRELTREIRSLEAEARAQAARAPNPDRALLELLAPSGPAPGIPAGFAGSGVRFEGIASWYGPGFEGNPTASGDIFDADLYTAASKELPLGTWLYVTHGGKGVVVLVNDRGPYIDGRILDLSRAAAFAIGITGLGWIEAEILIER